MAKPKCRNCKAEFERERPFQVCCSIPCAIEYSRAQKEKQESKKLAARKAALKTKAQWLREAQTAFNAYIRERDAGQPCISCGRFHTGQIHAGHYLSVGAHPELRFNEDNVHAQCQPCNAHLSGNIVNYRPRLIEKIGMERVEWLEGHHEPVKYSIDEIKQIKKEYQDKLKQLKKGCG